MNALWVWLGIAALCGVIELLTLEFVFMMFAAGAIVAGISGAFGAGVPLQIVVAAAVSAIGLAFVRPLAMRYLKHSSPESATNVDALIGRPVRIIGTVTTEAGTVQINGETWSARSENPNTEFDVGANAIVERINGAYLIITSPNAPSSR